MAMKANRSKLSSEQALASELGVAQDIWKAIIAALAEKYGPIDLEWKSSTSDFGSMCLLKHKKRTLLYLTPEKNAVRVAIVLGERAVGVAMASRLPKAIKTMLQEAKPYAEGRGIRFPVSSAADLPVVEKLVAIKTTPE
jgi:hypothetical protein